MHQEGWLAVLLVLLIRPAQCTRHAADLLQQQATMLHAPSGWGTDRQLLQVEEAKACPACVHPATVAIPTAVGTFLVTCGAWLLAQYATRRRGRLTAWAEAKALAKPSEAEKQLQMVLTDMTRMQDNLGGCGGSNAARCAPPPSHHTTTVSSAHGTSYQGRPLEPNEHVILGTADRFSLQTTGNSRALQPLSNTLFTDSLSVTHPAHGIDATRQGLLLASQQQHRTSIHDLDALELIATLGEGTYGRVYKANWKGIIVAVKVMELTGSEKRERMAVMEAAISSSLSHPNIVQTYTFVVRPLSSTTQRHSRQRSKGRATPSGPRISTLQAGACSQHAARLASHSSPGNTVQSPAPSTLTPRVRSPEQVTATDHATMASEAGLADDARAAGHEAQYLTSVCRSPHKSSLSSLTVAAIFGSVRQQAANQASSAIMGSFASEAGSMPLHSSYMTSNSAFLPLPPGHSVAQQQASVAAAEAAMPDSGQEQPRSAAATSSHQHQHAQNNHSQGTAAKQTSSAAQLPALAPAKHRWGNVKRVHSERAVSASAGNLAMSLPLTRAPSTLQSADAAHPGAPADSGLLHTSGPHTSHMHNSNDVDGPALWEIQLVQEFCEAGSLRDLLDKGGFSQGGGRVDLRALLETAMDVARALEHLHCQHIVHSDLKPRNVLLKANPLTSRGFIAKVADFGLSVRVDPHHAPHMANVFQGTLSHMAPEVLLHGQLGKPADVFAFGTVLWEMYTAERPFRGMSKGVLMDSIVKHGIRPTFPLHAPPGLVSLAQQCWSLSPAARPTFSEVLRGLQNLWQATCHGGCEEEGPTHSSMGNVLAAPSAVAGKRRSSCTHRMHRLPASQHIPSSAHSANPLPKMSLPPLNAALMLGSARHASGPLLVPLTCTDPTPTVATTSRMGTLTSATPCSGVLTTSDQYVGFDAFGTTNSALVTTINSAGGDYVNNFERVGSGLLLPSNLHSYGSEVQVQSERTSWVKVPSLQRGSLVPNAPLTQLPGSSPSQHNSRLCNVQIAYLSLVPEHASSSQAQTTDPASQSGQPEMPSQRAPSLAGHPSQHAMQLQASPQMYGERSQVQHAVSASQAHTDDEDHASAFSGSFAMHSMAPSPAPSVMQRHSRRSFSQPGSIDAVLPRSSSNHLSLASHAAGAGPSSGPVINRPRSAAARYKPVQEEDHEQEVVDHWSMGNTVASSEQLAGILLTRTATNEPPQVYHSTGFAGIVPASAGYQALLHDTLRTRTSFIGSLDGDAGHTVSGGLRDRMSAKSHYLEQSQSEEGLLPASAQWSNQSVSQSDPGEAPDCGTLAQPTAAPEAGRRTHTSAHHHPDASDFGTTGVTEHITARHSEQNTASQSNCNPAPLRSASQLFIESTTTMTRARPSQAQCTQGTASTSGTTAGTTAGSSTAMGQAIGWSAVCVGDELLAERVDECSEEGLDTSRLLARLRSSGQAACASSTGQAARASSSGQAARASSSGRQSVGLQGVWVGRSSGTTSASAHGHRHRHQDRDSRQ